ncbi:hypothetical protein [Aureispira sp. CCB-QB1]|uniref:hypothetical protein n=1 Tax=Aureispira sp. CCB-QB1 TaxID=1313421 RepID=UPI0012DC8818|nr:hypothetical protein [Aureispira sp. CCB-QB1]
MKYFSCLLSMLLCLPLADAQTSKFKDVPSIKIRKRRLKPSFSQALALPQTATSCDCPTNSNRNTPLVKLGCQHPDTIAVCQVVITEFDLAIISTRGEAIVLKDIQGSFLNSRALGFIRSRYGNGAFISYTNIKGMTNEGKEVVVPSFGTQNPNQRAQRAYDSIYNYTNVIDKKDSKIHSFELAAYNIHGRMVFRQTYHKDTFDKNAIRSDAVRYVFKDIQVEHSSGFKIEVDNFEVTNTDIQEEQLLSSND